MNIKELEELLIKLNSDYIEFKLGYPKAIEKLMELNITNIHKRIDELEKENKMRQDTIACVDAAYNGACNLIEIKLHEMKKDISCLFTSLKGVETKLMGNPFQPLKPHKCPVCEGSGKDYIDPNRPLSGIEGAFLPKDDRGFQYRNCNACDSKGIVWG